MEKIIVELNQSNSSKYKLDVLKKYQDNEQFKDLLELTYNKIKYNFYSSKETVLKHDLPSSFRIDFDGTLQDAIKILKEISRDKIRGHRNLNILKFLYNNINEKEIFLNIINRDLKCNINVKQINKVFKNLIPLPNYMRCDILNAKNLKKIKFPACIQVKMDGTYREFHVQNGNVTARTRSGEDYWNPVIFEQLKDFPDGYYIGELTLNDSQTRFKGNGLINSDNPPYNDIIFTMWDFLTDDDYTLQTKTLYKDRFNTLNEILESKFKNERNFFLLNFGKEITLEESKIKNLRLVESHEVKNIDEALAYVTEWMNKGLEGGVLKDLNNTFKNGTSKTQLKIKLKIDCEMRITGFTDGTLGTKREGKIGAIQFENDEKTIKGQCSGFTDEQMDYFTKNKDALIGKIISVEFNDLSRAENSDYYALSHPRFVEVRKDKNETDTLETVLKLKEMARNLTSLS